MSDTVCPCLTALVKVTTDVLNDQFVSRQRGYTAATRCTAYKSSVACRPVTSNSRIAERVSTCETNCVNKKLSLLVIWLLTNSLLCIAQRVCSDSPFKFFVQSHLCQMVLLLHYFQHLMEHHTHATNSRKLCDLRAHCPNILIHEE